MMIDKRIIYLMKNFKPGTTFLFINDYPWGSTDSFDLMDFGYNFICIGKGQDYWPFMQEDKIAICYSATFSDTGEKKLNCYPLHCPIFVFNKDAVINAEDRDVRVWAEVLNEGGLTNENL